MVEQGCGISECSYTGIVFNMASKRFPFLLISFTLQPLVCYSVLTPFYVEIRLSPLGVLLFSFKLLAFPTRSASCQTQLKEKWRKTVDTCLLLIFSVN
jgi:hypothetical protein